MQATWIFDLDNTLHCADKGIFAIINQAMTHYMAQKLDLSTEAASALRSQYWQDYGATLAGIQIHHPQIDLNDFLQSSHPLASMTEVLCAEKDLDTVLTNICAQKIVFSNGPSFYVQHLLSALKISHHFQAALGVDDVDYLYKPKARAFDLVCQQQSLDAKYCVMVDDSLKNLITAKELGMKTIWFGPNTYANSQCDYHAHSLQDLLPIYQQNNTPI